MNLFMNPFEQDNYFDMVEMTNALHLVENKYGYVRSLGLFKFEPVSTRTIVIEESRGTLNLLETAPIGSPGPENTLGKRLMRSFRIPHIPINASISPEDYANIRSFGTTNKVETLAGIYAKHLATIKDKMVITEEFHLVNALKGRVLDANHHVIVDFFKEFEIDESKGKLTVYFDLDNPDTNVPLTCKKILRHVEDHLLGETCSGVSIIVDDVFFDKLFVHPSVEKFYLGHQMGVEKFGGDIRKDFEVGGIKFTEYRGYATNVAGEKFRFVDEASGIAYPTGTRNVFKYHCAPADFIETVNTMGKKYYAKQMRKDFDRGIDIHAQTNPLPLCNRPALLVECKAGEDPNA